MGKIRWGRTIGAVIAAALMINGAKSAIASAHHRYSLWKADGVWCIDTYNDGSQEQMYGEQCFQEEAPSAAASRAEGI